MDFECEDWDIGREASGLATSLFQQAKKKNNRKRKGNQPADNVANTETSPEEHTVVDKKSKQEVPLNGSHTTAHSVEELGGERPSKKERKNLRRKKAKLRRKLMNMAAAEANAIDGKSAKNSMKEIKLDAESSSNTNEKVVKKKPKGKKKGKEKHDVSVKVETPSVGQSKDTKGEKVEKGRKRKLSKDVDVIGVSKTGNNDTSSPKKSGSVDANILNNSTDTKSDSPSKKKKRKRISKKNKFKGYVKPERKEDLSSTSLSESSDKNSAPDSKHDKTLPKTDSVPSSGETNSKSEEHENQSVKVGKKKKERKRTKSVDAGSTKTATVTESDDDGNDKTKMLGKFNKRNSLDPKVLSSILTSKTTDKQSSPNKSADDATDRVSGKTEVEKKSSGQSFLEKSKERLNAARFRYLNEQLYTTTGKEAFQLFKYDKTAFDVYHEGFQSQVEKWPSNPIDMIIKQMQSKPKHLILADFGCGDAKLARSVHQTVHSFDLVALNDHVTVCDISKVPLKDGIVDIAVFCLSLMGTNLTSYLKEANRVLKSNATLIIAEVTSRFQSIGNFIMKVEKMGFKVKHQNSDNKMFVMMEFKKTFDCKNREVEEIKLKPCVYKKR